MRDVSIFECGGEELVERNGLQILQREQASTDSLVPLGRWMAGSQAQGQEERQDWKSSVLRLSEPVQGGHSS